MHLFCLNIPGSLNFSCILCDGEKEAFFNCTPYSDYESYIESKGV